MKHLRQALTALLKHSDFPIPLGELVAMVLRELGDRWPDHRETGAAAARRAELQELGLDAPAARALVGWAVDNGVLVDGDPASA